MESWHTHHWDKHSNSALQNVLLVALADLADMDRREAI